MNFERSASDICIGLLTNLTMKLSPFLLFVSSLLPLLPLLLMCLIHPPPWDDACAGAVAQFILLAP